MLRCCLFLSGILFVGVGVVSCSDSDLPMPLAPVVSGDTISKPEPKASVASPTRAVASTHTQKTSSHHPVSSTTQKQPTSSTKQAVAKTATTSAHTTIATTGYDRWQWPVNGALLPVTHSANFGIDISTKPGAKVHAARAGVVIYVGSGIAGYGNLIILKHGAEYLSAYGYNAQNFVHEGQQVKAGQVIATVQGTSAKPHTLHFEIRDRGQPVNPLNYLPKATG